MVVLIINRVLIFSRHAQGVGGARKCAKTAIAASRHVDVIYDSTELNRGPVRGEDIRFIFPALLGFDGNAIRRAGTHALTATKAVLDFIKQPHPATLRQAPFLRRILQRE